MSDRLTSLLHKIDCLTDQEMWQLMKDVGALRGALTAEKQRSERRLSLIANLYFLVEKRNSIGEMPKTLALSVAMAEKELSDAGVDPTTFSALGDSNG